MTQETKKKKIRGLKRIGLSLAHGAFTIGKNAALKELDRVENQELKEGVEAALVIAEDAVEILTDSDPLNRDQFKNYLSENPQKLSDAGLTLLRGVMIEKLEGEALQQALDLLGVLAGALAPEA